MKILILTNSTGNENQISNLSVKNVLTALEENDLQIEIFNFEPGLSIDTKNVDIVFNLAYGELGEDGTISSFIEQTGLPYIGPPTTTCLYTYNKIVAKNKLTEHNIAVPADKSDLPCIAKPITGGSSLGVKLIKNEKQFNQAKKVNGIFFEEYLPGKEYCATAIKTEGKITILPIVEIVKTGKVFTNDEKYTKKKNHLRSPSDIDRKTAFEIRKICKRCFNIFNCSLYTKVDIVLDKNKKPNVIEVDALPGFGPKSILPFAAEKHGIPFNKLILGFIEEVLKI